MDIPNTARTPRILIVEDERDAAGLECEYLEEAGYDVDIACSSDDAVRVLKQAFVDLLVVDERLGHDSGTQFLAQCRSDIPGLGAVLVTGYADIDLAVRAMRVGVLDLLQKPIHKAALITAVRRALSESALTREARFHRWQASRSEEFSGIIGTSLAFKDILETVRRVMGTTAPVLIQGESGTGKELIARAIHRGGVRHAKPFVSVNAGGIPETLLESTLFGSRKGAFTDSKADQIGLFQAADGGTLFLDEIGETTPAVQVRLLRALQEKEVLRVGDVKATPVNVRIIAATNRDLPQQIQEGKFRRDLYYRLAVVSVKVPALRDRPDDIAPLARHLLEKHSRELGKPTCDFEPAALEKLHRYQWPGNVRELDNVIQRAVILSESDRIDPNVLVLERVAFSNSLSDILDHEFRDAAREFERLYFEKLLHRARGNKSRAAVLAGLERTVLYKHLNKIGSFDNDN